MPMTRPSTSTKASGGKTRKATLRPVRRVRSACAATAGGAAGSGAGSGSRAAGSASRCDAAGAGAVGSLATSRGRAAAWLESAVAPVEGVPVLPGSCLTRGAEAAGPGGDACCGGVEMPGLGTVAVSVEAAGSVAAGSVVDGDGGEGSACACTGGEGRESLYQAPARAATTTSAATIGTQRRERFGPGTARGAAATGIGGSTAGGGGGGTLGVVAGEAGTVPRVERTGGGGTSVSRRGRSLVASKAPQPAAAERVSSDSSASMAASSRAT